MPEDLKKQAEELGIKVDGRWSDERLREEIDNALEEPGELAEARSRRESAEKAAQRREEKANSARTDAKAAIEAAEKAESAAAKEAEKAESRRWQSQPITVKVNRDFWDEAGNRHRKGIILDVPLDAALDGIETGKLSRVKA